MHLVSVILNGPAHFTESHNLNPIWALVIIFLGLYADALALFVLAVAFVRACQGLLPFIGVVLRRFTNNEKLPAQVFLELTFPADTARSAYATEQLHILLRTRAQYRSLADKLAGGKKLYSLELVATKNEGIRYIMMVPAQDTDAIYRSLVAYLPGLKIRQISDYTGSLAGMDARVVELKLSADFALPLREHKSINEHDPIAYLTGHMTNLAPDELVSYQVVTTPMSSKTHRSVARRMRKIRRAIASSEALTPILNRPWEGLPYALLFFVMPPLWLVVIAVKFAITIPVAIMDPTGPLPILEGDPKPKRRVTDPYEMELGRIVKAKLDQPLFEVSLRLLIASPAPGGTSTRIGALAESFQTFSSAYQSIKSTRTWPLLNPVERQLRRFHERALSPHFLLTQPTILSSFELADLYHFPDTDLTKTQGLIKNRERRLPAPVSQVAGAHEFDVILGQNEYGSQPTAIGLTLDQRRRHAYVIGKTGMGKTTLLKSSIYQDMLAGKGLAVLDPHGDLFHELLGLIPPHRLQDVVVFNPADRDFPIGLNILNPGITFSSEDDRREWITSLVITVFKKLADDKYWGPKMEHILRNATLTALSLPNPTLYTIQRLLTDQPFRTATATKLDDPILKQFWVHEFSLMGKLQLAAAIAPLTQRLGQFITATMSRHILLQSMSTLSVQRVMDEGKILLVNLSKGELGEDQSTFFGTLLTSLIWTCAYQRTKLPEAARRDFFVYVDEFQTFATPAFGQIISEGRKFRVSLIASHQNVAQIEDLRLLKTLVANSSSLICFKAAPDDEAIIAPFMAPEVTSGDITNLAPHQFLMKTTGPVSEDAFSGRTVPLDVVPDLTTSDAVVAASRQRYAKPKDLVAQELTSVLKTGPRATPKAVPKTKPRHVGATKITAQPTFGLTIDVSSQAGTKNDEKRG
jgi:uncharacterized protein DUF87